MEEAASTTASSMELNQQEQLLKVLEVLKQASHELQRNPTSQADDPNNSAIKALLELETEADTIFSTYYCYPNLTHHLSDLRSMIQSLHATRRRRYGIRAFLTRLHAAHEISRLAASIESEIQAWIDRESIKDLLRTIEDRDRIKDNGNDDKLWKALVNFEARVSQGFNRELQDLVLRSRVFSSLEQVLCDSKNCSKKVREQSAFAIASLIRFNKDVFVGEVLMGHTIRALVSMVSVSSFHVLCLLIKSIKSPLVDEIESNQQIPKIIASLSSQELRIRVAAMDCLLEIGYYGRKEAIQAMLQEGLIKKSVELQRSELGGDLIDSGRTDKVENRGVCAGGVEVEGMIIDNNKKSEERLFLEMHPFASCVARFAVQIEVGEGLRQREKRAFKLEILGKVREASVSDAEAATIVAEVLWGSSP